MIRSGTLLLVLGLAASTAQAQGNAPAPAGGTHFTGPCREWTIPDPTKQPEWVCYLKVPFDPSLVTRPGRYQSPACDPNTLLTSSQASSLAAAYSNAPRHAQTRLCRLTKLFIVPPEAGSQSGWDSWGLWEPPVAKIDGRGVYIGLSEAGLLPRDGPSPLTSVRDTENLILGKLMPNYVRWEQSGGSPRPPRYTAETSLGRPLGLLDVILHELGHVLLADTNADEQPHRKFDPPSKCFDADYVNDAWTGWSRRQWVAFRAPNGAHRRNVPTMVAIDQLIGVGDYTGATRDLNESIGNEFVSLFAGLSPEEDFVETYKYSALRDAGLQTLTISFPGLILSKDTLASIPLTGSKVRCLSDLGILTPLP